MDIRTNTRVADRPVVAMQRVWRASDMDTARRGG
jgi:hypothetical protein